MPERVDIAVSIHHELRQRGIFETPVFSADITVEGVFASLDLEGFEPGSVHSAWTWRRSPSVFQTRAESGMRPSCGREGEVTLSDTSSHGSGPIPGGLESEPVDAAAFGGAFSLNMDLRGTERFSVVPVGDVSTVAMQSTWPHPSFDGGLLPDARDVTPDGFTASWTTRELARGSPA